MVTDSMFLRLAGGNVADPTLTDNKVSAHTFIALLQMWKHGDITKAQLVAAEDFTHIDDSADLDSLKAWYLAADVAGLGSVFFNVLESRIIMARDKRNADGTVNMDGKFGFAVKATFIGGA
ncbi:hypothetical protein LCGC14_1860690, partial [marine sediment metagenome]